MSFHTDNVAILLATYNGEKYIAEQLDSIIEQSCNDWELYIHDDGSHDLTCDIINKYATNYPNQIHIIDAAPRGSAKSNFLFLMSEVDAPYYMFCDQDDVWKYDKLEVSLSALKSLESANGSSMPLLVFSDSTVVDSDLNTIHNSFLSYQRLDPRRLRFSELIVHNVVPGNTVTFNHSLLEYALKYSDEDAIIMHDTWCALVATYFGKIAFVRQSTLLYRQHDSNALGAIRSSGPKFVLSMIRNINVLKSSILATRRQSGEFARAFELGSTSLPARYASIGTKNKLQRLSFYKKNHIRRSGLYRSIGFYLLG